MRATMRHLTPGQAVVTRQSCAPGVTLSSTGRTQHPAAEYMPAAFAGQPVTSGVPGWRPFARCCMACVLAGQAGLLRSGSSLPPATPFPRRCPPEVGRPLALVPLPSRAAWIHRWPACLLRLLVFQYCPVEHVVPLVSCKSRHNGALSVLMPRATLHHAAWS